MRHDTATPAAFYDHRNLHLSFWLSVSSALPTTTNMIPPRWNSSCWAFGTPPEVLTPITETNTLSQMSVKLSLSRPKVYERCFHRVMMGYIIKPLSPTELTGTGQSTFRFRLPLFVYLPRLLVPIFALSVIDSEAQ